LTGGEELARRAFGAIADMKVAGKLETVENRGGDIFASLDLPYFAIARFFRPDRSVATKVLAGKFHPEWARRYVAARYATSSSIAREMLQCPRPYSWSEVLQRCDDPMQIRIYQEATEFGLRQGLFVPLRWADGSFAAVVLGGEHADLADPLLRSMAEVAAAYYASETRRLLEAPNAYPLLTPRQRDCLKWVREGKSTFSISQIIGISGHMVDEHIANACRRLGVRTRTQAAVEATLLGILDAH